jgi:hypothetical protein
LSSVVAVALYLHPLTLDIVGVSGHIVFDVNLSSPPPKNAGRPIKRYN